jgi:thioredoxin reductase (NADPH)
VHRRDAFRASKVMAERVLSHPKIRPVWNARPVEVLGDDAIRGLVVEDASTGERRTLDVGGLFVAIGHTPNTSLFAGQLEMDSAGYIVTRDGMHTNVPGVFACGDVQDRVYRQAITAAGSGCQAALDAEHYLDGLPEHAGQLVTP